MKKVLALVAGAIALTAAIAFAIGTANAKPRAARCVVTSAGTPTWRGPCLFEAERGGSFTITRPGGAAFGGTITAISLGIVSPGVGEVRGLTRDGINSRWGEARRSPRDRACWQGEEFSVCVY